MNRILVIQSAFIGDAILSLPMIQELKKKDENLLIDVICIEKTFEIFSSSPFVNEVFILDKKKKHKSIFSLNKFAKEISEKNYSEIITPHRSIRTCLLVMLINAPRKIGFTNSAIPFVFTEVKKYNYDFHEVKRNLCLINYSFENENWKIQPLIYSEKAVKEKIDILISENKLNEFIAIAPGTEWETKQYPSENFSLLIEELSKNHKIILIGSEKETELCEELISESSSTVINLSGKLSIVETIELLKKAKLLISNDSAPTHFAMAADIKVLTIYCSTSPKFGFYPYNSKSRFLSMDNLRCKPCGIHGYKVCPLNNFECGNKLEVKDVLRTANEMLNEK